MSDINNALSALADAYLARGEAQARVKAKYAQYERDMAAAKEEDIGQVAQALVAAWDAGASVAATGRAMGASNIYNARRAYYDAAKALQGDDALDRSDFLDQLYRKARGEDVQPELPGMWEESDLSGGESDSLNEEQPDRREWVQSWTISEEDENNSRQVSDPQGRVASIRRGRIFGTQENLAEFAQDADLHSLVQDVHNIDMKEFGN